MTEEYDILFEEELDEIQKMFKEELDEIFEEYDPFEYDVDALIEQVIDETIKSIKNKVIASLECVRRCVKLMMKKYSGKELIKAVKRCQEKCT